MPEQQIIPLTDEELLAVAGDQEYVNKLTSEERRRLRRLRPIEKTAGGFARNVLSSGQQFASDVVRPVLHPIETARGLATAVAHPVDTAKAVGEYVSERYGSVGDIADTLYTDPIGALADVSTVLTGVGGTARGAGTVGRAARVSRAGQVLTKAGDISNPLALPAAAVGQLEKAAPAIYQNALKPSLAEGNRRKIVQQVMTGLRAGIPVSEGGRRKLRQLEDAVNHRIGQIIDSSNGTDAVSKSAIGDAIVDVAADWERRGKPAADVQAILRVAEEWEANRTIPGTMTRRRAQELKQSSYQTVGDKFGELTTAAKTGEKAKGHALKVGIEQATEQPARRELVEANKLSGRLQELSPQLERAVARDANRSSVINAGSLYSLLGGTAAYGATGDPIVTAAVAALTKAADSPAVRSRIAIELQKAPDIATGLIRAALAVRAIPGDESQPVVP